MNMWKHIQDQQKYAKKRAEMFKNKADSPEVETVPPEDKPKGKAKK